ncbi:MAG: Carboxypeptidase regulatory-like domain [Firmicutes bacterium]|nr:Carboxypeptidase regulatory-like domain [Bacillota bacterium]
MSTMFQHHPDGWVYVRGESESYCDTPANFAADLGATYSGLPDGYISRIYVQGKRHVLSDGNNETTQTIPWTDGDTYIAELDTLLVNKVTRNTKIELTVTESSGTALSGVTVSYSGGSGTTDSSGQVTFSGLTAGTYEFTAAESGYTSASVSVTAVTGSTVTGTIALTSDTTTATTN